MPNINLPCTSNQKRFYSSCLFQTYRPLDYKRIWSYVRTLVTFSTAKLIFKLFQ